MKYVGGSIFGMHCLGAALLAVLSSPALGHGDYWRHKAARISIRGAHSFGHVAAGASRKRHYRLKNTGRGEADSIQISLKDGRHFQLAANECHPDLPRNVRCTIEIAFAPLEKGRHTDTIVVSYRDSRTGHSRETRYKIWGRSKKGVSVPICGNGRPEAGEQCDDGNRSDGDACTNSCESAACGDGLVFAGVEACDDGNTTDGDGCSPSCAIEPPAPECGNAIAEAGEQCDNGAANGPTSACLSDCRANRCGDSFIFAGVEECDDANLAAGDGCNASCQLEICGNARLDAGEACDDGANALDGACPACRIAACGDGQLQAGIEACDDGNTISGDGCNGACALEPNTGAIAGVVTDGVTGEPLAGARISAHDTAGFLVGSVTTAADGGYSMTGLAPQTYALFADRTGYVSASRESVAVVTRQTVSVSFALASTTTLQAQAAVTVLYSTTGQPAPGAMVTLTFSDGSSLAAQTDGEGRVVFSQLPVGMALMLSATDGVRSAQSVLPSGLVPGTNFLELAF